MARAKKCRMNELVMLENRKKTSGYSMVSRVTREMENRQGPDLWQGLVGHGKGFRFYSNCHQKPLGRREWYKYLLHQITNIDYSQEIFILNKLHLSEPTKISITNMLCDFEHLTLFQCLGITICKMGYKVH